MKISSNFYKGFFYRFFPFCFYTGFYNQYRVVRVNFHQIVKSFFSYRLIRSRYQLFDIFDSYLTLP